MTLTHDTDRLESARLVLRRIAPDDLPFFARIHALPEVAQYLGPGYPRPPEKSAAWLRGTLASYESETRNGWFGRTQAPAGVALTLECELGYTFDPAVWGQGFATEAVNCVRDYARDVLELPYGISVIHPHNTRSRRVAERAGARADGQMDVVGLTWDRWVWPLATGGA